MNDEDITGLTVENVGSNPNPWGSGQWSWEVIPTNTKSISDDTNIQQQIYELVSKNYSLEYKNKELTDKINNLEAEIIELMCKVEDLQQIIIKICEDYILSDDD